MYRNKHICLELIGQCRAIRKEKLTVIISGEHRIDAMLASPARPLSEQARATKFDRCWQLAAQPMRASQPLKDLIANLENCVDVNDLVRHLEARP